MQNYFIIININTLSMFLNKKNKSVLKAIYTCIDVYLINIIEFLKDKTETSKQKKTRKFKKENPKKKSEINQK